MTRDELMVKAIEYNRFGNKIKGELYKFLASEMDRADNKVSVKERFAKIIKTQYNSIKMMSDTKSVREKQYLEELLPKMIDHEAEFDKYINSIEIYPNIGLVMKYFKNTFGAMCDMKEISRLHKENK